MADIVFLIQTTTCIADIPERMLSYRIYELSALVATIFFVVAILKKEAGAKNEKASDQT